jgi:hypothetical protein
MEWELLSEVMDKCSEMLKEDGTKIMEQKKKNEGSLEKVMKKINAQEPAVKERAYTLFG